MEDKIELFFLQIQGSGRVELEDGADNSLRIRKIEWPPISIDRQNTRIKGGARAKPGLHARH